MNSRASEKMMSRRSSSNNMQGLHTKMKAWLQSIEVMLKELDSSLQKGDQEMEKKIFGELLLLHELRVRKGNK